MSVRHLAALALCCAATVPFSAVKIPAQTSAPATTTASATVIDPAKSLDVTLSAIEKDIVSLAEAMPADKYTFAPTNADFAPTLKPDYTGVRTFGQEVAHIAQGNYGYGASASGTKPPVDMQTLGKGVDKDTAVASLKASFAFLHQGIATLTPANAFEHASRGPNDTRVSTFAAGMAHSRDHYGQLIEYLRMNGITPPASQGRPPANPAKS